MKRFIFIAVCLLFLFQTSVFSQHESGKTGITIYSEESDSARRVNFRAFDYFEQERYRPDHSKFSGKGFFDNMSIGLYGGVNGLLRQGSANVGVSPEFGLSVSKYFTPSSGISLSASYSSMNSKRYTENLETYGLSLDYMFNLTNFINDFDPNRKFNFISVQGLGMDKVSLGGDALWAYNLHWGLRMKFNTRTRLDFYLEPGIRLYTDGIDHSGTTNWRRYDVGYETLFGFEYSLGKSYREYLSDDSYLGWEGVSLGFSGGIQTLPGASGDMTLRQSVGPSVTVSAGKWFLAPVGMRVSLMASGSSWMKRENSRYSYLAAYGGGRLEAMFNLMGFSPVSGKWRFSLVPSIGLEAGLSFRQAATQTRVAYYGLTGAMQFKYRLDPDLSFFIEPRYTYLPSSASDITLSGKGMTVTRNEIASLNFGVEMMNLGEATGRKGSAGRHDAFSPHFIFSAGIGGVLPVQQSHSLQRVFSHMANIGIGYWFNPVSGLRADGSIGTAVSSTSSAIAQINISASLNYTLNVLNLVAGYDSSRNWDAEIFAGPVLGVVNRNPNKEKFNPGIQGGGRLAYKMPLGFDFYVEPRMYMYSRRLFPVGSGTPLLASMSLGGTYHFAYRDRLLGRESSNKCFLDNTFVALMIGGANNLGNFRNYLGTGNFLATSGVEAGIYLGKWVTPYVGMRASVFGDYYSYLLSRDGKKPDRSIAYLGTGFEFMFNPFRVADPDRHFIVEVVPVAGIRAGKYLKQRTSGSRLSGANTAFTAAMQLRYNITPAMAIVMEPRWTRALYNSTVSKKTSMVRDNILSLNVGVELIHSRDEGHRRISVQRKGYERFWFASAGVGFDGRITSARYGKMRLGYDFGFYGGYSLTPFSSFRLGYDHGWLPSYGPSGKELAGNNFSLDYMFDISNFVNGYDENRRVGLQLFAGPLLASQKTTFTSLRVGMEAGAVGYIKLADRLYLDLQPRGRAFLPSVSDGKNLGRLLLFDFTAGLTYRF